jgi:hypothetical protein
MVLGWSLIPFYQGFDPFVSSHVELYGIGILARRIASLTAPLTTSVTVGVPIDCPHFINFSFAVGSF